jgi:hypothetical protein
MGLVMGVVGEAGVYAMEREGRDTVDSMVWYGWVWLVFRQIGLANRGFLAVWGSWSGIGRMGVGKPLPLFPL